MLDYVEEDKRPTKRPATYQDVIDAPEHKVAEILDGELFLSPRPASRHALATMGLAGALYDPFTSEGRGGPGGWWLLIEPELHFGPDVIVPDLAGWKCERMPRVPDAAFVTLAPDWACEVLSPSTSRIDRLKKVPIYAREGVSHLWLVDPILRVIEVLRLRNGELAYMKAYGDEQRARIEPFDAIELALSRLWLGSEPTSNGQA
jgi:Uma2 family endonuclease